MVARQVVATVAVGDRPQTLIEVDGLVWVNNAKGGTVTVLDAATCDPHIF